MTKVLVRGPVLTRSGYGEHVRFILRSLRQLEDNIDLYVVPLGWGHTGWVVDKDGEREWFDSLQLNITRRSSSVFSKAPTV